MKFNRASAAKLVRQLLEIPGKSGEENQISQVIQQRLLQAGVDPKNIVADKAHKKSIFPDSTTGNLIVNFPGTFKAPRRMLMAHMDTVPICQGCQVVKRGDRFLAKGNLTGLGADDRSGVAVVLNTALEILKQKLPHPPLTFLLTVQEEVGLKGARYLDIKKLKKPQLSFNWDGGNPYKLTVGAIGGYRMAIDVYGIASHAGVAPEKGASAIAIASTAIAALHQTGWHGQVEKPQGVGTCNVGVIQGGQATNVVTDHVHLMAEARSHDIRFMKRIVTEIEKQFKAAVKKVKNNSKQMGEVKFSGQIDYEPFQLPQEDSSLAEASQVIQSLGETPETTIANGGLDANWLMKHGIPTVSLGSGQLNQHMVTEELDIPWYLAACEIALKLATAEGQENESR